MPSLSPTMSQGALVRWHVREGSEVTSGDSIAEIETDKATLDFDTIEEGVVAKILVQEGTKDIQVGTPIAVFVEDAEHAVQFKDYNPMHSSEIPNAEPALKASTAPRPPETAAASVKIGPAARKLAAENRVALSKIRPTGPKGILTRDDVMHALSSATTPPNSIPSPKVKSPISPTPPPKKRDSKTTYTDIPLSQMRTVIAKRLLESKTTIPGMYFTADCKMDEIQIVREKLKETGTKVSVNDFITKAVANALRDVPRANTYWDTQAQMIKEWTSIDISIAVSTPTGLITPIVKNADSKSISDIGTEIRALSDRARKNKLKPEEFMGGSFTISNLGMYGMSHFSAIINPPQGCIMAVGATRSELMRSDDGQQIKELPVMSVTLTADSRVFDGATARDFLEAFRQYIEHPISILV